LASGITNPNRCNFNTTATLPSSSSSSSSSHDATHAARFRSGPTALSKILLTISVIAGVSLWIEPSILNRGLSQIGGDFCISPPYLWRDQSAHPSYLSSSLSISSEFPQLRILSNVPDNVHGWASWMDIVQWVAYISIWLQFLFIRSE